MTLKQDLEQGARDASHAVELAAEARFHSLAFALDTPVVIVCAANVVRYANAAARRMFDDSAQDLIGRPFYLALPAQTNGNIAFSLPSGKRIEGEVSITATVWNGELGWMAVLHCRADLRAAAALDAAAHAVRSRFLTHVSHELRTPLNSILGFAELMQSGVFGPLGQCSHSSARYGTYIADIHESGRKLLALTDDLLELSRFEQGSVELQESQFELGAMVDELTQAARAHVAAGNRNIELRVGVIPCVGLRADRARLRHAFAHIIANALTHGGTQVELAAEIGPAGQLVMSVSDDGQGFAANALLHAFTPFLPASDPDRADARAGAGLGLALAQRTFSSHGGSLRITSTPGAGAILQGELPARRISAHHLQN